MSKRIETARQAKFISIMLLVSVVTFTLEASAADQVVKDQSGSTFMEEVPSKPPAGGQVIRSDAGSVFMEELPSQKKKPAQTKMPAIDFSSLGVPVDPKGRIVPIIQPETGPVLRNSSRIEVEYTPPAVYVPYYSPFMAPYSFPQSTPYGVIPRTVYSNPLYGYFPVPLGLPQYFSSSTDDQQPFSYNNSGTFYNYPYGPGNYSYQPSALPFIGRGGGGLFSPFGASSPYTTVAPFGGSPFSYFPSLGGAGMGMPYSGVYPYSGGLGMPPLAGAGPSVWSPRWRAPWRAPLGSSFYLPQVTQFQQQGSVTPLFPSKLDDD